MTGKREPLGSLHQKTAASIMGTNHYESKSNFEIGGAEVAGQLTGWVAEGHGANSFITQLLHGNQNGCVQRDLGIEGLLITLE